VEIQRVRMVGRDEPKGKDIQLENPPEVEKYDTLVFGSPVHGFSIAQAMKTYLEQVAPLQDKKIACFVTKGLPFNWTGGTRATGQMKKICQSKGGILYGTIIVVWNRQHNKKIAEIFEKPLKL